LLSENKEKDIITSSSLATHLNYNGFCSKVYNFGNEDENSSININKISPNITLSNESVLMSECLSCTDESTMYQNIEQ